jgi:hypothetical protein
LQYLQVAVIPGPLTTRAVALVVQLLQWEIFLLDNPDQLLSVLLSLLLVIAAALLWSVLPLW